MLLMGTEDLHDCLVESLPMGDITDYNVSKIQKRAEAIVLGAIEKIEGFSDGRPEDPHELN